MWCPHDIGRDSWVWGEQGTRAMMNSPREVGDEALTVWNTAVGRKRGGPWVRWVALLLLLLPAACCLFASFFLFSLLWLVVVLLLVMLLFVIVCLLLTLLLCAIYAYRMFFYIRKRVFWTRVG